MKYRKFIQVVKDKQGKIPSSLERLQMTKKDGSQIIIDPETVEEKGVFKVRPVAVVGNQIFIVCPLCGQIHVHGCIAGSRSAHCKDMTGVYEIVSDVV